MHTVYSIISQYLAKTFKPLKQNGTLFPDSIHNIFVAITSKREESCNLSTTPYQNTLFSFWIKWNCETYFSKKWNHRETCGSAPILHSSDKHNTNNKLRSSCTKKKIIIINLTLIKPNFPEMKLRKNDSIELKGNGIAICKAG